MRRLVLHLLINVLGLYLAVRFVPGISASGEWLTLVAMAVILGVVNTLIRPLLRLLSCPLIVLTLGLFTLVINALMLWLAGTIGTNLGLDFAVEGFVPAFWGALLLTVVNWALSFLVDGPRHHHSR